MSKVIHVSSSFPPALGGTEKVVQVLAHMQANSGLEVSVITSNQHTKKNMPSEDFQVVRLKSYVIANTTIMPSLLLKLLRIRRGSVVHVHITQAYAPEVVWLASRVKRFNYIAHIHLDIPPSSFAGALLIPYKRFVLRRVLRSAAYVVVFSEEQKETVTIRYGIASIKVKVIPNGVEEKFYYDKLRLLHKKVRLLFVGRLSFQKNLPLLLKALEDISEQFDTTLVGDGELKVELKQLAKELNLKNVTFVGRVEGESLLKYYKQSDVFVLPSEREGMPLVLLEAMAMGLPIIATDVIGSRDVVKSGNNGFLVPFGDTAAFRSALLKIKSDEVLYKRLSLASRKMANQYPWQKISRQLEKLYQESYE